MSTLKSSAEDLTLNADGSGNDVIIQSDGSTKAIVTAEGNVGIGTASPSRKLDVRGAVRFSVNTTTHETFVFTTQAVNDAKQIMKNASSADTIVLNTGGDSWLNGGNVGIGTSSITNHGYDKQLQIEGASNAQLVIAGGANEFGLTYNGGALLRNYANSPMKFYTNNTERLEIDSSGNILMQGGSPEFHFGTTNSTHVNWRVACQETLNQGFEIASGTTSAGSGASSDTYTTRFTIESEVTGGDVKVHTGNLVIGTAGKGIDFSAQTATSATGAAATSEVLDHYEEGTWTPTINSTDIGLNGKYVKIGNFVKCNVYIWANTSGTYNNVILGGLPFASSHRSDFTFERVRGGNAEAHWGVLDQNGATIGMMTPSTSSWSNYQASQANWTFPVGGATILGWNFSYMTT